MATIATHNGSTVRQNHNLRTASCLRKEKHIDPTRPHETWKHETVAHAYHRLFDEAREAYNAAQGRADRKLKGSYLAEIQKDEKKHPCYEMIIGVYGDEVQEATAREIMRAFVDSWESRNPNLELIGAYYHADEEGKNAHVHIDYIPVAHGYVRGPETQTGLVRALGEQGFFKDGRVTAQMAWEKSENAFLEDWCRAYGLTVEHPQAGKQVEHKATQAYKIEQKLRTLEHEVPALERRAASATRSAIEAEARMQRAGDEALKLEHANSMIRERLQNLEAREARLEAQRADFEARADARIESLDAMKEAFQRDMQSELGALSKRIEEVEAREASLASREKALEQEHTWGHSWEQEHVWER